MSTHSVIARENADGTVDAIYCHMDGYLEGVGAVLRDHYASAEKVDQLIALGDLSSLGPEIGRCRAYGRDRGETGSEAKRYPDASAVFDILGGPGFRDACGYLFRDGEWSYVHRDDATGSVAVVDLADALADARAAREHGAVVSLADWNPGDARVN